jgi:hypothetical protein
MGKVCGTYGREKEHEGTVEKLERKEIAWKVWMGGYGLD